MPVFGERKKLEKLLDTGPASDEGSVVAPKGGAGSSPVAQLCRAPLLSREREIALFTQMNALKFEAARLRRRLASNSSQSRRLVSEIERLLAEADAARNQIVKANLRLVVANAKRYVNRSNPFDELISEASSSLIRAVEKFDVSLGNRFSTYATRAIRNNLFHYVTDRQRQRQRYPIADDEVIGALCDHRANALAMERQWLARRGAVREILGRLESPLREVIVARFGLRPDGQARTLKEVARGMGVSRERVRQIEARALRQLRRIAEDSRVEIP